MSPQSPCCRAVRRAVMTRCCVCSGMVRGRSLRHSRRREVTADTRGARACESVVRSAACSASESGRARAAAPSGLRAGENSPARHSFHDGCVIRNELRFPVSSGKRISIIAWTCFH